MQGDVLLISEVGRYLHRSVTTIRNYERDGRLCPQRTEAGWRVYSREDVLRLARELGIEPPASAAPEGG
jgi:DNA-binding transcriptional MerR regulator